VSKPSQVELVALAGDCLYYPTPPVLGGGQKVTEWLEAIAAMEEKRGATERAREAREIAEWLGRLGRWMHRENYEPAPLPGRAA
jgi:hypothetical protein